MRTRHLVAWTVAAALLLPPVLPGTAGATEEEGQVGFQANFPAGPAYDALTASLPGLGLLLDNNGNGRTNDEYCDTNGEANLALVEASVGTLVAGGAICDALPPGGKGGVLRRAGALRNHLAGQCRRHHPVLDPGRLHRRGPDRGGVREHEDPHRVGAGEKSPGMSPDREPSPSPGVRWQDRGGPRPCNVSRPAVRGRRGVCQLREPSQGGVGARRDRSGSEAVPDGVRPLVYRLQHPGAWRHRKLRSKLRDGQRGWTAATGEARRLAHAVLTRGQDDREGGFYGASDPLVGRRHDGRQPGSGVFRCGC